MTELERVERIRRTAGRARGMTLGIGDDCAIYQPKAGEELLFTTDMLIEGVHFLRDTHSAADIGHKALARGLSDIAAMGGTPRFCLLSLAVPPETTERWLDGFYKGLLDLTKRTRAPLAGGDLAHADKITCDIIVCGSTPSGTALRRSGAKPGDQIYVTGMLGGSAMGLATGKGAGWKRHLRPEPRLKIGSVLREKYRATSCMDLSDGLSIDLHRLCLASEVSADLDGDLPAFPGASMEQFLHGGEDYELLFTVMKGVVLPGQIAGVPVTRIGTVRKGKPGAVTLDEFLILPMGYDHFRKP
ncbi:MAG: thiamine-phosphate kinase [Bryobacterales bacterium]|nr:thiamine-phosphate kinase [Bryobacterales bacterium]